MRMYVASICCNVAKSHWLEPSRWLYANLLDGDIASNQLSWQWVAGAFSNKKYYANQHNINRYFNSDQNDSFLNVNYAQLESMGIPKPLIKAVDFKESTPLPAQSEVVVEASKQTFINSDP